MNKYLPTLETDSAEMLNQAILNELTEADFETEPEERDRRLKNAAELYKIKNEELKIAADAEQKKKQRRIDWSKNIIDILKVGVGVLSTTVWMANIMKFEETGTIRTKAYQLLPFKDVTSKTIK